MFITNPDPGFAGLRYFESKPVTVELIKAGGPYRYYVLIDRAAGPIPKLPLTQPPAASTVPAIEDARPRESRAGSMAFVLLVSASAGLAVFIALLLFTHLRSRRVVRTHSRRPSRP
jgi:hypothetical protein